MKMEYTSKSFFDGLGANQTTGDNSYVFDADAATAMVQGLIPPYVTPGSWQAWNASSEPCPAGYTCTAMGGQSLGAFSCDEMARIAVEEFGFGDVLAGAYCPEGETGVLNCPVGGYCPDTVSNNN